jgi:tRNA dimethylallyltransferase
MIVNVDSMQVYSTLDRLTARPQPGELALAPHRLYGHVDPSRRHSAGAWLDDVAALLAGPEIEGRTVIFVGGTGLYFRALLGGLSPMPAVPDEIRREWRRKLERQGASGLHALLRQRDPAAAEAIRPADAQRIVRALEILEATGTPISKWQSEAGRPLIEPRQAERYLIEPDRKALAAAIDARFRAMVRDGVMEEVRAIFALGLDPELPAMKAIGVRELHAADRGQTSLEAAIAASVAATRQYAKRQMTWFRHQAGPEWRRLERADLPEFDQIYEIKE